MFDRLASRFYGIQETAGADTTPRAHVVDDIKGASVELKPSIE